MTRLGNYMPAFKEAYFKSKILLLVATAQKVPHAYYKDHKLVFTLFCLLKMQASIYIIA